MKLRLKVTDGDARNNFLSAIVTGIALVLATPTLPFGFLAWFAFIPFFIRLEKIKKRSDAFRMGLITGLIYYTGAVYWIGANKGTILVARLGSCAGAVLLLSFTFAVMIALQYTIVLRYGKKGHFAAPFMFAAFETIWHLSEIAFPWPVLALTQSDYLPIVQLAAVGGSTIITMWIVAINAVITVGREGRRAAIVVIVMIIMTWGLGSAREKMVHKETYDNYLGRIALVQGNIDAAKKWKNKAEYSTDIYFSYSKELSQENPDLIVWPETAAPVYIQQDLYWRNKMFELVDTLNCPVVTGARFAHFGEGGRVPFNSAFIVTEDNDGHRRMKRYSKMHLVPFGERVPFQKLIPVLGKLNLGQAEFKPGDSLAVWPVRNNGHTFNVVPLICYESIFPDLLLNAVQQGADVILNLTNDGWFVGTNELKQHMLLSRMQTIAVGRSFVRATNTGISIISGPSGRILQYLPANIRGALVKDIPIGVRTPYVRGGWMLPFINLIFVTMFLVFVTVKNMLDRKGNGTND